LQFESFDGNYVRLLKEGDAVVGQHFALYFGKVLYLKLRSRVRSLDTIDDIRQETLARVLRIVRQGGVQQPERFGSFVNRVCNNVMMESHRDVLRYDPLNDQADDPPDPGINLDAPLVDADTKRQVHRVLNRLSRKDRRLLIAVFLEERDKSDICREYKVDTEYIRVLVHRAKCRFRELYLKHPPS
jgi:RNA polymerase sigma-70 factor, ECF subfamily